MKIEKYIKNKIFGSETETTKERTNIVNILVSSIKISGSNEIRDTDMSDSVLDKLEAILDEFILSDELEKSINGLSYMIKGLNIDFSIEDQEFMDKLSVITRLLEMHGYKSIEYITESELNKISTIYQELSSINLADITIEYLYKFSQIKLPFFKELENSSLEDIKFFAGFLKSLNLNLNADSYEISKSGYLYDILDSLHFAEQEMREKSKLEKIIVLLEKLNITQLTDFNNDSAEIAVKILDSLNIDIKKISKLQLNNKVTFLKKLELTLDRNLEEIKSKLYLIKEIKGDIEKIDRVEIEDLVKIINGFKDNFKGVNDTSDLMEILAKENIQFNFKNQYKPQERKLADSLTDFDIFTSNIGLLSGQDFKDVKVQIIDKIQSFIAAFGRKTVTALSKEEIESYSKFFKLFTSEELEKFEFDPIGEVCDKFNLVPGQLQLVRAENIKVLLEKLDTTLWQLDNYSVHSLNQIIEHYEINLDEKNSVTNEKITNIKNLTKLLKKEHATELNKELLDKISLAVVMLNKSKIIEATPEDYTKLEILAKVYGLEYGYLSEKEIESLSAIMDGFAIKDTGNSAVDNIFTAVKSLYKGSDQAKKESLEEFLLHIDKFYKTLGYNDILDVSPEEKSKVDAILQELNINNIFNYQIESLQNIKHAFGKYRISDLDKDEVHSIIYNLKMFGFNIEGSAISAKSLAVNIDTLGIDITHNNSYYAKPDIESIFKYVQFYKIDLNSQDSLSLAYKVKKDLGNLGFSTINKIDSSVIKRLDNFSKSFIHKIDSQNNKYSLIAEIFKVLPNQFVDYYDEQLKNIEKLLGNLNQVNSDQIKFFGKVVDECDINFNYIFKEDLLQKFNGISNNIEVVKNCKSNLEEASCQKFDQNSELYTNKDIEGICHLYISYHEDL